MLQGNQKKDEDIQEQSGLDIARLELKRDYERNYADWLNSTFRFLSSAGIPINSEDIDHLSLMFEGMVEAYLGLRPPGEFLRWVMQDSLKEASKRAYDTNLKCLIAYPYFIYNYIPALLVRHYKDRFTGAQ